jgi:hypothetical protein
LIAEYHKTIKTQTQKRFSKTHQDASPVITGDKIIENERKNSEIMLIRRISLAKLFEENPIAKTKERSSELSIALCSEELSLVLHSLVGKEIT